MHSAAMRGVGVAADPLHAAILRDVAGSTRVAIRTSLGIRPAVEKTARLD
jgi:hypothetical protein